MNKQVTASLVEMTQILMFLHFSYSVETALQYFRQIKSGVKPALSADVFPAIYDAGVIYGDLDDYLFVLEKFKQSTFASEQAIYLHALAASKTPYLQAKTLAFAISGQVRKQVSVRNHTKNY